MALLTDLLAAAMVTFAVLGTAAVALRAREYGMIGPAGGVAAGVGVALTVGMAVTALL